MLGYVPKKRYSMRPYFYNGPQAARRNRTEWELSRDFGVIYNLSNDSSRPATAEECERESNPETKRLKIVPDEFPKLARGEMPAIRLKYPKGYKWGKYEVIGYRRGEKNPYIIRCSCGTVIRTDGSAMTRRRSCRNCS